MKKVAVSIFCIFGLLYFIGLMCFWINPPLTIQGDGKEYWAMVEALQNSTVAVDDEILIDKYESVQEITKQALPNQGFFKAYDENVYSYHFWLYPLFLVPFKIIAEALNAPVLFEFYAGNLFIWLLMIFVLYKFPPLNWNVKQTYFALALMLFSPAVLYIDWIHPEVFTTSLVGMSLCFYMRNNLYLAVLFSGMAASQNPPIGLFTVFCGSLYLLDIIKQKEIIWRDFFVMGLCAIPLALSPLFYYIKFGTFNLIQKTGGATWSQVGFERFFSFWFDINQGMVVCAVFLVISFIYLFSKNVWQKNFQYFSLVILPFFMVILTTATSNWNSGQILVNRYVTWVYPFVAFYVVTCWKFTSQYKNIAAVFVALGGFIQILSGAYLETSYTKMHPWAMFICENYPALYNPEFEIFEERVRNREGLAELPVVVIDEGGSVRKALVDRYSLSKLLTVYEIVDKEFIEKQKRKVTVARHSAVYLNFPRGKIVEKIEIFNIGDKLAFSEDDSRLKVRGLSHIEKWGRWSDSKNVILRFKLEPLDVKTKLVFDIKPYINPKHPKLTVDVKNNGKILNTWVFLHGKARPDTSLIITKDMLGDNGYLQLEFDIKDPKSPYELGYSQDKRKLGIGFVSVKINNI